MSEHDDELARLHAADPVDQASLPSAADPKARALFERIIMNEPDLPNTTSTASPSSTRTRSRLVLAAAAAAGIVLLVAGGLALAGNDDSGDDLVSTTTTVDGDGGPITPGGTSSASCVELYDLQTLARREVAFDGTVAGVDGDDVTFTVNHWYRGGGDADVTLAGATLLGGLTSAGDALVLEPGTRLLVAGDGGFAWSCGFTQPYDASVAADWDEVLGG